MAQVVDSTLDTFNALMAKAKVSPELALRICRLRGRKINQKRLQRLKWTTTNWDQAIVKNGGVPSRGPNGPRTTSEPPRPPATVTTTSATDPKPDPPAVPEENEESDIDPTSGSGEEDDEPSPLLPKNK